MQLKKSKTIYKAIIFILISVILVMSNINRNSIASDKNNAIDVVSNTIIFETKDGVTENRLDEILKAAEKTLRRENRDIRIVYDEETESIYINEFLGENPYTQRLLHVKNKNNGFIVKE